MAKVHDRILELTFAADTVGHTVAVSAAKYYRTRADLEDSSGFALTIDNTSAQASPAEFNFGELLPPPTTVRLVFTGI